MGTHDYTMLELMACVMARSLRDGEVVAMGAASALPVAACRLAQLTSAPHLSYLVGGSGALNPVGPLAESSCDYSYASSARTRLSFLDIDLLLGRGRIDVFFAGGLQIDGAGRCNLVCVGDWSQPKLRGPGGVGLSFLAGVRRTILYTLRHDPRVLVERVDFVSGEPRKEGLLLVTPLCVMRFDASLGKFTLASLHPGADSKRVVELTGFALDIPEDVPVTPEPSAEELRLLGEIDPFGILKREAK